MPCAAHGSAARSWGGNAAPAMATPAHLGEAGAWRASRAALVIAHPGHELRVHRWLELARPTVFVLTDGSGHTRQSRLASTTAVLERAGAVPGAIYGQLADRELYRALLEGDTSLFTALADELAAALAEADVDCVAGDAAEGFNPGHDVCRLLLNTALERLAAPSHGGRRPASFEFPLDGAPAAYAEERQAIRLELDEEALERKLAAARDYPELAGEVEAAFARHGAAAFRIECLRPVRYGLEIAHLFPQPPFYETYGEQQVRAGIYRQVIRFREHLAPLAEALGRRAAAVPVPCASC
jgi:hypothetical protein